MSEDRYSIDDILAEIDRKKSAKSETGGYDASVTEIIGGSELEQALHYKKHSSSSSAEDAADEALAAKQRTEDEVNRRRSEEISRAADKAKSARKAKRETTKQPAAEDAANEALAAKQRTEDEVNRRRSEEISRAADKANYIRAEKTAHDRENDRRVAEIEREIAEKHSGVTAEISSAETASKLFGGEEQQPESEFVKPFVKPKVSEDSDIIFHTRGDLVPTETMEMRKQERIAEINRALLKADSEAETPDEMLDSLNPMDFRAKAVEEVRSAPQQNTEDTLAVAGNDLKRIAGKDEGIKEYPPVTSRKKSDNLVNRADAVLFTPAGRQHTESPMKVGESIVDELNRKAQEQRENNPEPTVTLSELDTKRTTDIELNIDKNQLIDTSAFSVEDAAVEAVRNADELAQKKKRKISSFILDDIGDEASDSDEDEDEYDDEDEEIDLDDENVIRERLDRASKGLASRLVILGLLFAAALFIAIVNQFRIDTGFLGNIIDMRTAPEAYLYTYLTIGILSFGACSSVISNGFARLIKLRPDGDTLCAFSHIAAIGSIIPYLSSTDYISRGMSHVYLLVSLGALCCNTISKMMTVRAAQRNFAFVSGDRTKYFVQRSDGDGAENLAKGAVSGMPAVASVRKTEMLTDFIISTYCEDASDRISKVAVPVTFCIAVAAGLLAYFTGDSSYVSHNLSWAFTSASAVFALGAAFSGSMIVTLPMLSASKKLPARNASILGYSAVESFSETNAVLVEANTLFPNTSVKINNIWDYNKHRSGNSAKVPIDEAIIYAASLSVAAGSVLADAFFSMLNNKSQLLKQVSGCVYENNLGVMGWIDRRRVILGNREHMKSHQIVVPDMKKENAANKNNDDVIYLAVGGEVCMLFFVQLTANAEVAGNVRQLAANGVSLIIKTVDGMVTPAVISSLFDIDSEQVRVIPFEMHEEFTEHTKFVPQGSAAATCSGTFSSFAETINASKRLRDKIAAGCIMQIAGMALGMLLAVIFTFFANYNFFNCFYVLGFNLVWMLLTFGVQTFKRI